MLEKLTLPNILFLDIETVPARENYSMLDEEWQSLWKRKSEFFHHAEDKDANSLYHRAGIYAEFGKVICISAGFFHYEKEKRRFRLKSFYSDSEADLLLAFSELLNHHFNSPDHLLCAHNGKEFDFPFLARRMLVNGIKLPYLLDIAGRKPWEIQHLDTMQLWRFGDYKHFTSLKLLCKLFGISSPKSDMDGSQVAEVYYVEKDLEKIREYCSADTLAVAQLLLKYRGEPLLKKNEVKIIDA